MNLDNVVQLLEQLIQKTDSQKIIWEKTSKSKSYKASLKTATVIVSVIDNSPVAISGNEPSYSFTLYDEKSDKLFEKSAGGLSSLFTQSGSIEAVVEEKIVLLFKAIDNSNGKKIKHIIDELLGL